MQTRSNLRLSATLFMGTVGCMLAVHAQAGTPPTTESTQVPAVRIQAKFEVQNDGRKSNGTSDVIIPEKSSWITLAGTSSGVVVLAKVANVTAETVRLDTIFLDSTSRQSNAQQMNGVISTPTMIVRHGEEARLETTTQNAAGVTEKIVFTVLTRRDSAPANSATR